MEFPGLGRDSQRAAVELIQIEALLGEGLDGSGSRRLRLHGLEGRTLPHGMPALDARRRAPLGESSNWEVPLRNSPWEADRRAMIRSEYHPSRERDWSGGPDMTRTGKTL